MRKKRTGLQQISLSEEQKERLKEEGVTEVILELQNQLDGWKE